MSVVIGPFTLTRAQLVPFKYKSRASQSADVAGDGSVAVSGSQRIERFHTIRCRLPRTEAAKLAAYIENSLRLQAEVVSVTDGLGVTRQMRYWSGDLDTTTEGGGFTVLELLFREETTL